VLVSLAAVAAFALIGLPAIASVAGLSGVVKYWLMPWLGYHFWMVRALRGVWWFSMCAVGGCGLLGAHAPRTQLAGSASHHHVRGQRQAVCEARGSQQL
jgi:hypothetical protein